MRAGRTFLVACVTLASALVTTAPTATPVQAANDMTPWTLPTMPAKCTDAQKSTGNVAGCLLDGTTGLPEARGWPTPPFPETAPTDPAAWTPIQKGDSGTRVSVMQQALVAAGVSVYVDGIFGNATEAAVVSFQNGQGLAATGIVDAATADALGILTTAAGGPFPPAGSAGATTSRPPSPTGRPA